MFQTSFTAESESVSASFVQSNFVHLKTISPTLVDAIFKARRAVGTWLYAFSFIVFLEALKQVHHPLSLVNDVGSCHGVRSC